MTTKDSAGPATPATAELNELPVPASAGPPARDQERLRAEFIREFGEAAYERVMRLVAAQKSFSHKSLLFFHMQGTIILEIIKDAKGRGEDRCISSVAELVGHPKQTVWLLRQLASRFTKKQLEDLIEQAGDFNLTIYHLRPLLHQPDDLFAEFLPELLQKRMTVRDIENMVKGRLGKRSGGGRPPSIPDKPLDRIRGLGDMVVKLQNYERRAFADWDALVDDLEAGIPDESVPRIAEEIEAKRLLVASVAAELAAAESRLADLVARLGATLPEAGDSREMEVGDEPAEEAPTVEASEPVATEDGEAVAESDDDPFAEVDALVEDITRREAEDPAPAAAERAGPWKPTESGPLARLAQTAAARQRKL